MPLVFRSPLSVCEVWNIFTTERGEGGVGRLNREVRHIMFVLYCIYCTMGIIIVRKLLTLPYTMDENFAKLQNKTGLYPRAPTGLQIRYWIFILHEITLFPTERNTNIAYRLVIESYFLDQHIFAIQFCKQVENNKKSENQLYWSSGTKKYCQTKQGNHLIVKWEKIFSSLVTNLWKV